MIFVVAIGIIHTDEQKRFNRKRCFAGETRVICRGLFQINSQTSVSIFHTKRARMTCICSYLLVWKHCTQRNRGKAEAGGVHILTLQSQEAHVLNIWLREVSDVQKRLKNKCILTKKKTISHNWDKSLNSCFFFLWITKKTPKKTSMSNSSTCVSKSHFRFSIGSINVGVKLFKTVCRWHKIWSISFTSRCDTLSHGVSTGVPNSPKSRFWHALILVKFSCSLRVPVPSRFFILALQVWVFHKLGSLSSIAVVLERFGAVAFTGNSGYSG